MQRSRRNPGAKRPLHLVRTLGPPLILLLLGLGVQASGIPAQNPSQTTALAQDTLPRPMPLGIPGGLRVAFKGLDPSIQEELPLKAAEVALGRALFFDPILSREHNVACASCHQPQKSFADSVRFSKGAQGVTLRNAPALINRILGQRHMWDGRAKTLEEQVLMPLANPLEMNFPAPSAAKRLNETKPWAAQFQSTFGEAPSPETIARALAAFVRALVQGDSPADRFLAGDVAALSPEEEAGMWVFDSRGKCWRCHRGANYSDDQLHTTGIGTQGGKPEPGAFAISGKPADLGRFKTPTLRGLRHSGPFMHDGSLENLEEVVAFYRRGGNPSEALSPLMEPLELTDQDAANLVAFLKALTPR